MTENGKEVHLEGRFGWFLSVIRPNGILVYMDTAVRAGSCAGNAAGMGAVRLLQVKRCGRLGQRAVLALDYSASHLVINRLSISCI